MQALRVLRAASKCHTTSCFMDHLTLSVAASLRLLSRRACLGLEATQDCGQASLRPAAIHAMPHLNRVASIARHCCNKLTSN